MSDGKWSYQAEKFSVARRCLMLPHSDGEVDSIVACLNECFHGLHNVAPQALAELPVGDSLRVINEAIQAAGVEDTTGRGVWYQLAMDMTPEAKSRLAHAVDSSATWFDRESH